MNAISQPSDSERLPDHPDREIGDVGGSGRYRANITAGSLKIAESRVIADLLLRGVDEAAWKQATVKDNLLNAKNPATAIRLARLIRQRLETMSSELWRMVRDGTVVVATHAVLAAAVKHSFLLGDFLDLVVRDQYRRFGKALTKKVWFDYLEDCRGRDPQIPLCPRSSVAGTAAAKKGETPGTTADHEVALRVLVPGYGDPGAGSTFGLVAEVAGAGAHLAHGALSGASGGECLLGLLGDESEQLRRTDHPG